MTVLSYLLSFLFDTNQDTKKDKLINSEIDLICESRTVILYCWFLYVILYQIDLFSIIEFILIPRQDGWQHVNTRHYSVIDKQYIKLLNVVSYWYIDVPCSLLRYYQSKVNISVIRTIPESDRMVMIVYQDHVDIQMYASICK